MYFPVNRNLPVLWLRKMNLSLKRGRMSPKLSLTPLMHPSCCTTPPEPSCLSSLVTAPASAPACRDTTTTKWGGPSLLPKRRFSVRIYNSKTHRNATTKREHEDSVYQTAKTITISFLFLRSWLALCLRSIFFSSFLCFFVRAVTETLPVGQFNTNMQKLGKYRIVFVGGTIILFWTKISCYEIIATNKNKKGKNLMNAELKIF